MFNILPRFQISYYHFKLRNVRFRSPPLPPPKKRRKAISHQIERKMSSNVCLNSQPQSCYYLCGIISQVVKVICLDQQQYPFLITFYMADSLRSKSFLSERAKHSRASRALGEKKTTCFPGHYNVLKLHSPQIILCNMPKFVPLRFGLACELVRFKQPCLRFWIIITFNADSRQFQEEITKLPKIVSHSRSIIL